MTIEFKNIYILLFYGQHMFVSYLHVPPPLIQQTINSSQNTHILNNP